VTNPTSTVQLPEVSGSGDNGVDKSRLQPPLFPGLEYNCRWVSSHSRILCTATGIDFDNTPTVVPVFDCHDGNFVYGKGARSLFARRIYNGNYQLVTKVLR
jgi:hypothetical protein